MKYRFSKWPLALLALQAAVPLGAQAPAPLPTQSDLNRNLTRLAENPRDIDALIGAGEAALKLKDPRAATGFFARADDIDPANSRVKAGLARSMLGVQQPAEALRLFQEAEKLGGMDAPVIGDRAFAYDLMGNQARAQADYAAAHRADPANADVIRRYAVSLGISGKLQDSAKILDPLLQISDREAWRDRAFIYAINGDLTEARRITQATMPAEMASAVDPYLQRMTLLTPAQQVAAVHLGQFPGGVMAMAPRPPGSRPPQIASAAPPAASRPVAPPRAPVVAPRPTVEAALEAAARPAFRGRVPAPMVIPPQPSPGFKSMAPVPLKPGSPVAVSPAVKPPPVQIAEAAPARPGFQSMAPIAPRPANPVTATPAVTPPPARIAEPAPTRPPAVDRRLADIFNDIQVPAEERAVRVAAVDLAEVAALQAARRRGEAADKAELAAKAKLEAKAKAEAEAKAKAKEEAAAKAKEKASPARIWVQIATGRDSDALASDMRKRRKAQGETFAGKTAWTADFGATNRLVIGPFTSTEKARAWLKDWHKSGGEGGYVWNSEKGLEVTKLAEK